MSEATVGVRGEAGIDVDDEARFERYVRERGRPLSCTAALLLGDAQWGEDLAQEVLARLATRWHTIGHVEDLDAYVHRALVNTAVSWRRRRWWQEHPTAELPDRGQVDAGYDDTVLRVLRQLPPGQRAVIVLRHYTDRTEQQTALLLGCSVGTVKSQHAKALKRLRELLSPDKELSRDR